MAEFGWDPYLHAAVRAFGSQVHALVPSERERVLAFPKSRRPTKKVQIVGSVVCVHDTPKKLVFGIDDGTDVIDCILWDATPPSESANEAQIAHARVEARKVEMARETLQLGVQIRCVGRVEMYQEKKQVVVENIQVLVDPNEELLHWIEVMLLSRKFYHKITYVDNPPILPKWKQLSSEKAVETEDVLKSQMLEHIARVLQSGRGHFYKEDVLKAEELVVQATTLEQGQGTEGDAMKRARAVARINKEFHSLVESGEVCEVDPVEGTFCLPDQSIDLEPIAFAFLQARAAEGYSKTTFGEVQEHITSIPNVYGANWEKIFHSLDGLIASSKIYEVEEGHYSLV
mmetsp:Transcript_10726/g.66128  ORF Transcript_10726/g.66128 Transcript_10726/m.66128 type:complete len:344 (-) Transcript_10726:738-1769(-)